MNKKTSILNLSIFILIASVSSYLLLFFPVPRQIGLTFRNTLYILPVIFLLGYIGTVIQNRLFKAFAFGLLFAAFLMPLSGLWNSGLSSQYIFGGSIPWSDGFTLQLNTLRFLYGQSMGQSSALRPISVVFFASILRLTNNNFIFLTSLIIIISTLCVLLCTDLLGKRLGPVAAAFFYTNAFFYLRGHQGEYMTEIYGFMVGMLSCYFLMSGFFSKKNWQIISGFALMSLALNGRPGPMFIFATAGLWYFFIYLKGHKNKIILGIIALCAMVSGFVINNWNTYEVYGSTKVPNRQLAEIVYGLCLGGHTWDYTLTMPEILALNDSDNAYRDLFQMCTQVIKENPENLWIAAKTILNTMIFHDERGAFSYFTGGNALQTDITRYGLEILWCLGIFYCYINRKKPEYSFLLACMIGMVLSQALGLVITTYRLRYHAATIWLPGIIIGLFPQSLVDKIPVFSRKTKPETGQNNYLLMAGTALGVILILSSIISPRLLNLFPEQVPAGLTDPCLGNGTLLFTKIDEGSYFYMEDTENMDEMHYPYFRLPYIRQHFHDTASVEIFDFTDSINNPTAIIRGIDLKNWQDALIFAPLEMVEEKKGFVQFCGDFINPPILRNDRFFIPTEAYFIEE